MNARDSILALSLLTTAALGTERLLAPSQSPLPGKQPEHALLERFAGHWNAAAYLVAPDGSRVRTTGEERGRLTCDGTWLLTHYEGETLGAPYEGVSLLGYDPALRKYVATWVDAQTPGLHVLHGEWDAEEKRLTLAGKRNEGGRTRTSRWVFDLATEDERTFSLYEQFEGAPERLQLQTVYTRIQEEPPVPPEEALPKSLGVALPDKIRTQSDAGRSWSTYIDRPTLSSGVYLLRKGERDGQSPHEQDELYYVVKGRGVLRVEGEDLVCEPGSLLFVAAGAEHRFHGIEEDLELLVFFSKASVD